VRRAGIDQLRLLQDEGLVFPVKRCDIEYLRPARLEDEIVVHTAIEKVGGASIDLTQDVFRQDEMLTRAQVRLACIDREGRPRRLPVQVKNALAGVAAGGEGS
jgi:acyl-CoA thioester hydrolase